MLTNDDLAYIDVRPLRVAHRLVILIGWITVLMFTFFTILSLTTRQAAVVPIFLFFVGLGLLLLLIYGTTEWDSQYIRYRAIIGQYEIPWDIVTDIEMDPQGTNLVFKGRGRQLVIPGPFFWSGRDKHQALRLLHTQIQQRRIVVRETAWAAFKYSKKTKVH